MQIVLHNISQEEVEEGQIQYVLHGKDHDKNRCAVRCLCLPDHHCQSYFKPVLKGDSPELQDGVDADEFVGESTRLPSVQFRPSWRRHAACPAPDGPQRQLLPCRKVGDSLTGEGYGTPSGECLLEDADRHGTHLYGRQCSGFLRGLQREV